MYIAKNLATIVEIVCVLLAVCQWSDAIAWFARLGKVAKDTLLETLLLVVINFLAGPRVVIVLIWARQVRLSRQWIAIGGKSSTGNGTISTSYAEVLMIE